MPQSRSTSNGRSGRKILGGKAAAQAYNSHKHQDPAAPQDISPVLVGNAYIDNMGHYHRNQQIKHGFQHFK